MKIDKNTHVYCLNCIWGNKLLKHIQYKGKNKMPKSCKFCYPYEILDSRAFELRKNYCEDTRAVEEWNKINNI